MHGPDSNAFEVERVRGDSDDWAECQSCRGASVRRLCRRGCLDPGPMAGGLRPVATGRHVTPAAPAGPRLVVEDPTARVVVADPDAVGIAGLDLADERACQTGE